ncbi:hypothetical protein J6590_080269 [Homalodisca vitripennis]|nr:hypothetical protein J6590_080269 [Homalodisca vitripennis]
MVRCLAFERGRRDPAQSGILVRKTNIRVLTPRPQYCGVSGTLVNPSSKQTRVGLRVPAPPPSHRPTTTTIMD